MDAVVGGGGYDNGSGGGGDRDAKEDVAEGVITPAENEVASIRVFTFC